VVKEISVKSETKSGYSNVAVHVRLGRISFDDALVRQEESILRWRTAGSGLPVIFSLEHEPVITCGRSTSDGNLLLPESEYKNRGIDVRRIDRGGDVTWHGPGQAVVYPIIVLREHSLRATEWVELLEQAMIDTCADFDVHAFRREGLRGCFTDAGKIGAVGTAVKAGGITKHGIAFNVCPDLDNFAIIVPCGISDHPVTRLSDLCEPAPDFDAVVTGLVSHISELLGLSTKIV
jgi:lipoate-protein ligase B